MPSVNPWPYRPPWWVCEREVALASGGGARRNRTDAAAAVDIRTYEHDRLLASNAIRLEREVGRPDIKTERELRSRDAAAAQPHYAVRRAGQHGWRGLHFPDLAVDGIDGRPLAVEVELTAKGRGRLDSIVAGYVAARHIAAVRYYAAPAAKAGLERAIARAGAGELFHVYDTEEIDP